MAAWGYGFYLLVLKVSLTRERYFHHSNLKYVSPRGHVISSMSSFDPPSYLIRSATLDPPSWISAFCTTLKT